MFCMTLKDCFLEPKFWFLPQRLQATISFIIFWDFLMFYQIYLSPQVKRWAIISYKHGIYELSHELPNDLRLRKLRDLRKLGNIRKVPKLHRIITQCPVPPKKKMKALPILAENSWKTDIKLFPLSAISHAN